MARVRRWGEKWWRINPCDFCNPDTVTGEAVKKGESCIKPHNNTLIGAVKHQTAIHVALLNISHRGSPIVLTVSLSHTFTSSEKRSLIRNKSCRTMPCSQSPQNWLSCRTLTRFIIMLNGRTCSPDTVDDRVFHKSVLERAHWNR